MDIASLRAELESDRAWRDEELAKFHNIGSGIGNEDDQKRYRRALVLLLYAHFEGHCKFALTLYLGAVNREDITCKEATFAIAAASMADIFRDLMNVDRRPQSAYFPSALPDDPKLRKVARMREFIERADNFHAQRVLMKDDVVDTESNLTPSVLRKSLYRLGLPHDMFDEYQGKIHRLVNLRNDIAHGSAKEGIEAKSYEELRTAAAEVMTGLSVAITDALIRKQFLRVPPRAGGDVEHRV